MEDDDFGIAVILFRFIVFVSSVLEDRVLSFS